MNLPAELISSLRDVPGFDEQAFLQVHASGEQVTSIRLNPGKRASGNVSAIDLLPSPRMPVPWTDYGYYLSSRPSFTFDPLFHAGCYYVQEASSMFLEFMFRHYAGPDRPLKVLDLCAAPGGKSTHLLSLLPPGSFLVSNEVIRSRVNILRDNIIKWGDPDVIVTSNDPQDFSKLEGYFDLIVVDAPCSGSGLFRREPAAIDEWSENNVQLCCQRQQRILADIWPSLKPGGRLIYSTCSYSPEEDEEVCEWAERELNASVLKPVSPPHPGIEVTSRGYRFWPDKILGEGFFISCFEKTGNASITSPRVKKQPARLTSTEISFARMWMNGDWELIKHNETVYAWPLHSAMEFAFILQELRVVYSGIRAGELVRNKMIPDHALAMSSFVPAEIPRIDIDPENAIRYLQRKDLHFGGVRTGWHLITFKGFNLGWVNVLGNRTNNYYPLELRILREK